MEIVEAGPFVLEAGMPLEIDGVDDHEEPFLRTSVVGPLALIPSTFSPHRPVKMSSGSSAVTPTLGASTSCPIRRSTATLATT